MPSRRDILKALPALLVPAIVPEFGKESIKLGSGDYLEFTPQDIDFGKDDFTIEAWIKFDNPKSVDGKMVMDTMIDSVRVSKGVARYDGNFDQPTDDQWHHYALVQKGNERTSYVDGDERVT